MCSYKIFTINIMAMIKTVRLQTNDISKYV